MMFPKATEHILGSSDDIVWIRLTNEAMKGMTLSQKVEYLEKIKAENKKIKQLKR